MQLRKRAASGRYCYCPEDFRADSGRRIGVLPCRPRLISFIKSSGYHGPAYQLMRLSWPDISLGKPLCTRSGEARLAVVLSRQRLTRQAIRVGMVTAGEPQGTKHFFSTEDLPTCTSSMGRRSCSTYRLRNQGLAREYCCAPSNLLKESIS